MNAEYVPLIRPIHPDEYPAEAALLHAAYAAGPYAPELAQNEAWGRVERDTAGRDAAGRVLIAEEQGEMVGAASVLRHGSSFAKLAGPGEAELRLVAVAPRVRGRGYGAALVRAGLEEALGWGATALRLDTGVKNPAQHLYERLGFERTPELDEAVPSAGYGGSLSYRYPLQGRDDVRVRLIRPDEISAVSDLVLAAYRDDYAHLDPAYLADIADVAGRVATSQVWVAEDCASGELLGTVTTPRIRELLTSVARSGEMDIRLLGVSRAARGRGIGALLTQHSIALATIRGASGLTLETSPLMGAAWRLYERLGFDRLRDREREITLADGSPLRLLTYGFALPE
ncbi:GNAT family N-acetyltransferase [Leucobacter albus]|uniref:GNAT family N-acetyltransferase n=1 Tax=Leucobacter albus TaxID=272210 RepID=A0ABW3TP85_9MICO